MSDVAKSLRDCDTPAVVLDRGVVERNCRAMAERAARLGVKLRPHLKTAKSADVARLATAGQFGGITVSTLAEARYFAREGFRDITYAVGITQAKIGPLAVLQAELGVRVTLVADNAAAIMSVARWAHHLNQPFAMLLEIDSGGGRGGVAPESAELIELARLIEAQDALRFQGVLTHAGHSYHCADADGIRAVAEQERRAAVTAASRLREAGLPCPVVSVGSTPTAVFAASLAGVTEMRPGVYTLFDLDQVARGVCELRDVAISVLATVIGHNPRSQRLLIDAGALALSKDQSAAEFRDDIGFGLVCPLDGGAPFAGLHVVELHQEHGFIAAAGDIGEWFARLPVGGRVRILPNHACMTAAPYERFLVVDGQGFEVVAEWEKATGW